MLFIFSFESIIVVTPNPNFFLWIATSVADAAAININGVKTLLASCLSAFPIKNKWVFSNAHKSLTRDIPNCPILWNWVFDNVVFFDKLFANALWCSGYHYCTTSFNKAWTKVSPQVQTLLAACRRFAMVRISNSGPGWK